MSAAEPEPTFGVRLRVIARGEDGLTLAVSASNRGFAGGTRLYVPPGMLAGTAAQLTGFPAHPDDTRYVLLGAFGPELAGGAASLAFSLVDEAGRGQVQVVIEADGERTGVTETVTLALAFDFAALDAFVAELRELEGAAPEAAARLRATD